MPGQETEPPVAAGALATVNATTEPGAASTRATGFCANTVPGADRQTAFRSIFQPSPTDRSDCCAAASDKLVMAGTVTVSAQGWAR